MMLSDSDKCLGLLLENNKRKQTLTFPLIRTKVIVSYQTMNFQRRGRTDHAARKKKSRLVFTKCLNNRM